MLFFARVSVVGFGLFMGVISVIFYKVRTVNISEPCSCFSNICMRLSMIMLNLYAMLLHINSMVRMTPCGHVTQSSCLTSLCHSQLAMTLHGVLALSAEAAVPPGACTYDSMVSRHGCMYTMLSDVLVKLVLNRLAVFFKRMVAGVVQASIDLNFLYFMMATITCCGVAPLIAAVTWAKTTGWGACTGTLHLPSASTCT